jgi:5-amino-6-(5-phosphoribosylamino)uracil reductase
VGAATVRTGGIGPARLRADLRERRGGPPAPIVVVSRSLDLDWSLPLFTEAETPTIVVTSHAARERHAAEIGDVRVLAAGDDDVDLPAAVRALQDGHPRLLCEGGPSLAAALIRDGLADELCLNIAPTLLGGGPHHTRPLAELPSEVPVRPAAVYLDEGVLFLRYRLRS